jgi:lipoate-protein ligase A
MPFNERHPSKIQCFSYCNCIPNSYFIIHHSSFTMICRLLRDTPASGAWNMAVDESLLAAAAEKGLCTLRFYGWEEPTLSLGYFQEYADRGRHPASSRCPCVRRPSGGGAILHDRELTYSFAVPPLSSWAKKHLTLYEAFHAALVEVLAARDFSAALCPGAKSPFAPRKPHSFAERKATLVSAALSLGDGNRGDSGQPFLCFERHAPGDVLVGDIKIAGSAQRRFCGAVVQHGSILLDRSAAAPELPGLNDLGGGTSTLDDLANAWLEKLREKLDLEFQPGTLSDGEQRHAIRLAKEKYGADAWNRHRGRSIGKP